MKYVMDTSAFTSIDKKASGTKKYIIELSKIMLNDEKNKYYMPKIVWIELERLLVNKGLSKKAIYNVGEAIIMKQPSRMEILLPAQFIYEFVNELRSRVNKGLRAAEKAVLEKSKNKNRPDADVIHDLRDKYKTVMRQGMLDSEEDLDVLILAKEIKATIIAHDEGIEKWADKWGIHYIRSDRFENHIKRKK